MNESGNCDLCNDQNCSSTFIRIQPEFLPENESVVPTAAQKKKIEAIYSGRNQVRSKITTRNKDSENATDDKCWVCEKNRVFDYIDKDGRLITNWIKCDHRQCNRWFHWRCVDIKELPPEEFWFCKQKCLDEVKIKLISKYYKNLDILFNSINY